MGRRQWLERLAYDLHPAATRQPIDKRSQLAYNRICPIRGAISVVC